MLNIYVYHRPLIPCIILWSRSLVIKFFRSGLQVLAEEIFIQFWKSFSALNAKQAQRATNGNLKN